MNCALQLYTSHSVSGPFLRSFCCSATAQLASFYSYAESLVATNVTPGLSIAIARNGRMLPPRAWGLAGPDAGAEVNI